MSTDSPRLTVAEALDLAVAVLTAARVSRANAAAVARALVDAELSGQDGHGLRRLPSYAAQARAGKVDGFATPVTDRLRPAVLAVDAAHGFAYPALELACAELPAMARAQGVALAGIRHSHHAGVAGLVVERLAREGLVALMFANAPASIAPWGAARPLYGTDPIAFAAPLTDGHGAGGPVVVDVSLSRAPRGRLMAAVQAGTPIPEGWALDPEGRPTTDPNAGMAGTMVPMGEAKGTALALMVELLAAGLTGARFADEASSLFDAEGPPPGLGQLILAIDAAALSPDAVIRFARMAQTVMETPGARLPGARRHALRARLEAEGIAVAPGFLAELRALAG
jgi:(2R)-3-sulfolactate dehydrogenase (NADP+)